jgi:hypothetical protein
MERMGWVEREDEDAERGAERICGYGPAGVKREG